MELPLTTVLHLEALWARILFFHTSPKTMYRRLPHFDCNLNTGEEQARGRRMTKATNVVYHDKAYPSALILSIVPQLGSLRLFVAGEADA
jgi:hypothetical protein